MNPFKVYAYWIITGREKYIVDFQQVKEGIDYRLFILVFA